jgi:Mg-chelatase subunit ChlD
MSPTSRLRAILPWAALPLLLLVLQAPLLAKLDATEWREVKERADKVFGQPGQRAEKQSILAKALEDDLRRSRELIADAFVKDSAAWIEIEQQVRSLEQELYGIQKLPMAKRTPEDQTRLRELEEKLGRAESLAQEERDALDDLRRAIVDGPPELMEEFLKKVKRGGDWPLRAAAISVAARRAGVQDAMEYLQRGLDRDKDARVRMAGLEALRAALAEPAEEKDADRREILDSLVIGRLADPDWGVQLFAVQIVDDQGLTRAIPHLINALGFAGPRVAEAIAEALRKLTGENFDPYADVWARWWEDNQEKFEEKVRVKAGKPKREPPDLHFYGLQVKSDRIVFIIDASDSMKLPTKNENPAEKWKPRGPVTGSGAPPPPPPPEEILSGPKIDVAKHELKKALKKLPRTAKFNLIAFNSAVLVWQDKMMDASEKNIEDALQWVRVLEPKGSTYIDGALRQAFRIAGLGAVDDKYPEVNVDTIVLLSDGAPTDDGWPESKLMDPEEILQHVREWNRFRRVVIHCIGIDIQHGIEFLQKLAAENGGEYIDR